MTELNAFIENIIEENIKLKNKIDELNEIKEAYDTLLTAYTKLATKYEKIKDIIND